MNPEDAAAFEEEACIRRAEDWAHEQGIEVAVIDLRSPEEKQIAALTARVEALEHPSHNLRAALACQQAATEALAHLNELLAARVRTLEGLLLTALVAIDGHTDRHHKYRNEDVYGAVEQLREALGREKP